MISFQFHNFSFISSSTSFSSLRSFSVHCTSFSRFHILNHNNQSFDSVSTHFPFVRSKRVILLQPAALGAGWQASASLIATHALWHAIPFAFTRLACQFGMHFPPLNPFVAHYVRSSGFCPHAPVWRVFRDERRTAHPLYKYINFLI